MSALLTSLSVQMNKFVTTSPREHHVSAQTTDTATSAIYVSDTIFSFFYAAMVASFSRYCRSGGVIVVARWGFDLKVGDLNTYQHRCFMIRRTKKPKSFVNQNLLSTCLTKSMEKLIYLASEGAF